MDRSAPRATRRSAARLSKDKHQNDSSAEAASKTEQNTVKEEQKKRLFNFNFKKLRADPNYHQPSLVKKMKPEDFTMDYYRRTGLSEVLIFDCDPEKLGMKMVDDSFTVDDVARLVGGKRMISVFDLTLYDTVDMPLQEFVDYYNTPEKDKKTTYNVLSLECSNTGITGKVLSPSLVRQVDFASIWPDERKTRTVSFDKNGNFTTTHNYPRVEYFCLMSPNSCYTDFHVDFHGSSVWYHVKKGSKVFWIVEPTERNLEIYEQYMINQDGKEFFGDKVDKCARIEVRPGNTLILPAGWIHAVYTPEDSLVFGGNFLHSMSIRMQLDILEGEKRIGIDKKYRYPLADEVVWFLMNRIVKSATGRQYIRPASRNLQKEFKEYVGDLYAEKRMYERVPRPEDYEAKGIAWKPQWEETDEYTAWMKRGLEGEAKAAVVHEMEDDDEEKEENNNEDSDIFGGYEDWFPDDATYFHPSSYGLDWGAGAPAIHAFPISEKEPTRLKFNKKSLRESIHPEVIEHYEILVDQYLKKTRIDLPLGLNRPNSLIQAFCELLRQRRRMALIEDGLTLPPSILESKEKLRRTQEMAREEKKRKMEMKKKKRIEVDDEEDSDYDPAEKRKKKKGRKSGDEGRSMGTKEDLKNMKFTPNSSSILTPSTAPNRRSQSLVPTPVKPIPSTADKSNRAISIVVASTTSLPLASSTPVAAANTPSTISSRTPSTIIRRPFSSRAQSTVVNRTTTELPLLSDVLDTAAQEENQDKMHFALFCELNREMNLMPIGAEEEKEEWKKKSKAERQLYQSRRCIDEFSHLWEAICTRSPQFYVMAEAERSVRKELLMQEWVGLAQDGRNVHLSTAGLIEPLRRTRFPSPNKTYRIPQLVAVPANRQWGQHSRPNNYVRTRFLSPEPVNVTHSVIGVKPLELVMRTSDENDNDENQENEDSAEL